MPADPSSVPGENFRISRSAWQETKYAIHGFFFLHVTLTINHVATIASSLAAQRSWQDKGVLTKRVESKTGVKYQKSGSAVDFIICLHHGRLHIGEQSFVPKSESLRNCQPFAGMFLII